MALPYHPQPKPEPRRRMKARRVRQQLTEIHTVRAWVFAREWDLCRCCRFREAHSLHELVPRSRGGKVSKTNSIAVCGSGTTLCHGFLQTHQIDFQKGPLGAEAVLGFKPRTKLAADHLRLKVGEWLESPPMRELATA